jgi:membrane protein implicated in regulation of membrane protease activity
MTLVWLLSWWNLIFILPFGLALFYIGLYTMSGLTLGEGEADLHGDVGGDVGGDADLHADVDLHADADLQHDFHVAADAGDAEAGGDAHADTDASAADHGDADAHGGSGQPIHLAVLSWLGVGRVPLSIVLIVMLLFWGSIGFVANALARPNVGESWRAAMISVPAAMLGTLVLTRCVVLLMGRWLPLNETSAKRRHAILGLVGEALYDIDANFGLVIVREAGGGNLFQVPCRVTDGAAAIPKGSRVKLVAYGGPDAVFYVVPYEENITTISSATSASGTATQSSTDSNSQSNTESNSQSNSRFDRK